jgi:fused signal recognition particle receptor
VDEKTNYIFQIILYKVAVLFLQIIKTPLKDFLARAKQKEHIAQIRQKAMERKREMKKIRLKAKLMKLEPKIELATKNDEFISNKITQPQPQPQPQSQPQPEPEYVPEEEKTEIEKPKLKTHIQEKTIYQEVEDDEEEEIVHVKKNKSKPQESLDKTLNESAQGTLYNRIVKKELELIWLVS